MNIPPPLDAPPSFAADSHNASTTPTPSPNGSDVAERDATTWRNQAPDLIRNNVSHPPQQGKPLNLYLTLNRIKNFGAISIVGSCLERASCYLLRVVFCFDQGRWFCSGCQADGSVLRLDGWETREDLCPRLHR